MRAEASVSLVMVASKRYQVLAERDASGTIGVWMRVSLLSRQ